MCPMCLCGGKSRAMNRLIWCIIDIKAAYSVFNKKMFRFELMKK